MRAQRDKSSHKNYFSISLGDSMIHHTPDICRIVEYSIAEQKDNHPCARLNRPLHILQL